MGLMAVLRGLRCIACRLRLLLPQWMRGGGTGCGAANWAVATLDVVSDAVAVAVASGLHSARRYCCCFLAGEALRRSLPWGVAGCSSRRPTRFFAPPKKWGKKGGTYDGSPCFARTARAARD